MPFLLNTGRPADAGSQTPSLQPLRPTLPTTVRQRPWARLGVAALGISVLAACSGKDSSTQPGANKAANEPTVGVVVLATENQTLSTELPGRTTAFQNADIRPQINGIIQKRQFTEGSLV